MNATIAAARAAILGLALALVGCGGGGGGSSGTASTPTPTNTPGTTNPPAPVVDVMKIDMPTAAPPPPVRTTAPPVVNMAPVPDPITTTPTATTIPNSLIPAAGVGTRDPYFMAGGGYGGDVRSDADAVYPDGVTALGKRIEGPNPRNAQLEVPNPPRDVRTAWRDGWTGQGVNILIADGFGTPGSRLGGTHGYTVGLSALEIAPGANYFGFEIGLNPFDSYGRGGVRRAENNALVSANTRFDVINLSIGSDPLTLPTTVEIIRARIDEIGNLPVWDDVLGGTFLTNADDAVITKAAGNENTDAALAVENFALVLHDETEDRVLIIGALNRYAQEGGARLSSYSNYAGVSTDLQERFLVEYGGSPYDTEAYLCDASTPTNVGCRNAQYLGDVTVDGTSFAAPRVAGHAALVRHKFPGLDAMQTTKILLDTATTQGLICHPNCDAETYGQGRVSITDALSPIGKLQ